MIKRIIEIGPKSLIATDENFKNFIEKFESEINRGISTLCILSIVNQYGNAGVHGYQIAKDLGDQTNKILVIEEGTLYPILRKLESEDLVASERVEVEGRLRKNYHLTKNGMNVFNRMVGFYSKLTEVVAPLFDVGVHLKQNKYLYCPKCANKIDITNLEAKFCDVCGHYIEEELKERGLENE